jgi:hypothetical protein
VLNIRMWSIYSSMAWRTSSKCKRLLTKSSSLKWPRVRPYIG